MNLISAAESKGNITLLHIKFTLLQDEFTSVSRLFIITLKRRGLNFASPFIFL